MLDAINAIIDGGQWPAMTALLLGVLTSIAPCPLAANVAAVAFIARSGKSPAIAFYQGASYVMGRAVGYSIVAALLWVGLSSFRVAGIFQGWGEKVLGPILMLVGLIMLDVITISFGKGSPRFEAFKERLAKRGWVGAFALGVLLSAAFCPYSGALFFGALMPLVMRETGGLVLVPLFALGSGLPVVLFAAVIGFAAQSIGKVFRVVQTIERYVRLTAGAIFILCGMYYSRYVLTLIIESLGS